MTQATENAVRANVKCFKMAEELGDIRDAINVKKGMQSKLIDKMTSLLTINRSIMSDLITELKLAVKFPEEYDLSEILTQGHEVVWSLANNYSDLEAGIRSKASYIKDGQEYIDSWK